jgi:hypothetical protein
MQTSGLGQRSSGRFLAAHGVEGEEQFEENSASGEDGRSREKSDSGGKQRLRGKYF